VSGRENRIFAAKWLHITAQGFYEAELVKSVVKKGFFGFESSCALESSDTSPVTGSSALGPVFEGLIAQVGERLFLGG
jgi:hypothetical protein